MVVAEPEASEQDNRQMHLGAAFMIAALLVALLPLFKRAATPPATPAPMVNSLPSRLQPPDLHAQPKAMLVASAAEPGKKAPVVKPAKRRPARKR